MTAVSDSPASTATIPVVVDHHARPWRARLWAVLTDPRAREAYLIGRALRHRRLNRAGRPGSDGWVLLDQGTGKPYTLATGTTAPVNTYRRALRRGGWQDLGVNEAARLIDIHPRRGGR